MYYEVNWKFFECEQDFSVAFIKQDDRARLFRLCAACVGGCFFSYGGLFSSQTNVSEWCFYSSTWD